MRKLLATAMGLAAIGMTAVGLASTAGAADIPRKSSPPIVRAPAPAYVSPLYDWSGFYVGIFGGGGWGRHNYLDGASSTTYPSSGGLVGGTVGANWQMGNIVLGAEGDLAWANITGTGVPPTVVSNRSELHWVGTLRGRAGIALSNILLYGTGGWAYGGLQNTNTAAAIETLSTTKGGWTAGGGLEYAFTPNVSGKVEYRYYDFGRVGLGAPANGALPYSVSNSFHTVTIGLNYKWGGPTVARY